MGEPDGGNGDEDGNEEDTRPTPIQDILDRVRERLDSFRSE